MPGSIQVGARVQAGVEKGGVTNVSQLDPAHRLQPRLRIPWINRRGQQLPGDVDAFHMPRPHHPFHLTGKRCKSKGEEAKES